MNGNKVLLISVVTVSVSIYSLWVATENLEFSAKLLGCTYGYVEASLDKVSSETYRKAKVYCYSVAFDKNK